MKSLAAATLTLLSLYAGASVATAQETRRLRIDASSSLIMPEIGAIATVGEDSDEVTFGTLLPEDVRSEENRDLDLRQGDAVLMINGERIRSLGRLRTLYEKVTEGEQVKLALKRGEQRFLVAFSKGAGSGGSGVFVSRHPGGGGGTAVRVIRAGGGGDVEFLHEGRVILGEREGAVHVLNQLQDDGELRQGDVIETLAGKVVGSLAEFQRLYTAVDIGEALSLAVRRGEESLEVELTKAERPAGMMIR